MDSLQAEHPQALGIQGTAQEEGRRMISHVVLFRPKASLSATDRKALVDALQHAVVAIPLIRRARFGKRILLNRPGYETQMPDNYEYSAIFDFDSEADLRAYLDHPSHVELGR